MDKRLIAARRVRPPLGDLLECVTGVRGGELVSQRFSAVTSTESWSGMDFCPCRGHRGRRRSGLAGARMGRRPVACAVAIAELLPRDDAAARSCTDVLSLQLLN
jgi:hypothetical protein